MMQLQKIETMVTKAGYARKPKKQILEPPASLKAPRSPRKAGFFSFAGQAANEKAALSKTGTRFWTIPKLRVFNFAHFVSRRFKLSCLF
jgi:hypothetical protein